MTWPASGTVYLDGLQFTTDPAIYETYQWDKRTSAHPLILAAAGTPSVVVQDFGVRTSDLMLKLGSGPNFIDHVLFDKLHERYRAVGATYSLTDWLDNHFTVFMERFHATAFKKGRMSNGDPVTLFTYELDLRVTAISLLRGQAYTEAV